MALLFALSALAATEVPRIEHRYVQHLVAPPERVLSLLTPLGERAWAVGWEPEVRWSAPPPGEGTLFVTRHPRSPETVWILRTFDVAAGHVAYVHLTPGSDVVEIDIRVHANASGGSDAEISYTWTALSEIGRALVATRTADWYVAFMQDWERELNHFLSHGRKLDHAHRG